MKRIYRAEGKAIFDIARSRPDLLGAGTSASIRDARVRRNEQRRIHRDHRRNRFRKNNPGPIPFEKLDPKQTNVGLISNTPQGKGGIVAMDHGSLGQSIEGSMGYYSSDFRITSMRNSRKNTERY